MLTRLICLTLASTLIAHPVAAKTTREIDPEVAAAVTRQIAILREPANVSVSHIWFFPGSNHRSAIESLERIGAPAVDPLIKALDDPAREVRFLATLALRELNDRRALPALIHTLSSDSFWGVREGAAYALMEMQDTRAIVPLLEAVRADQEGGPAHYAIYALRAFPSRRTARALSLLLHLSSPRYSQRMDMGDRAARSLGEMGLFAEEALLLASRSSDPVVRRHAATGLGALRRNSASNRLFALLDDPDPGVRSETISTLAIWRERDAALKIADRLSDPDSEVRISAAIGLGSLGEAFGDTIDPRVSSRLIRAFDDPDLRVVDEAIKAAGNLRARLAVLPLCGLLAGATLPAARERGGWLVRRDAAEALGRIADPRALDFLIASATDENQYVREAVLDALGSFRTERAKEALTQGMDDGYIAVRRSAVRSLGGTDDIHNVPLLIRALEDTSEGVRVEAAIALGLLGGEESIAPLQEMVRRDRPNYPVYSKAIQAIARIRMRLQDRPVPK